MCERRRPNKEEDCFMYDQQNSTSGKVAVWVALCLVLIAGAAFAAYTFYYDKFSEIIAKTPFSEYLPKKASAANKPDIHNKQEDHDKHGAGGKSVKDILGGPAFSESKVSIQQVALHGGAPEPIVKASLAAQTSEPAAVEVAPPSSPQSAPAQSSPPPPATRAATRAFPPFPKTNVPTLNFMAEQPQQSQPAIAVKPAAPPPAAPAAPPPPPPPPKPRATMLLSNLRGRLSDRNDITVSMSVELAYDANNALREELEFKRDLLSTVAGSVLRKHEYGTVNTAALKTDILSAFNGQLQAGKLVGVEVKDLQIGQIAGK